VPGWSLQWPHGFDCGKQQQDMPPSLLPLSMLHRLNSAGTQALEKEAARFAKSTSGFRLISFDFHKQCGAKKYHKCAPEQHDAVMLMSEHLAPPAAQHAGVQSLHQRRLACKHQCCLQPVSHSIRLSQKAISLHQAVTEGNLTAFLHRQSTF
jgi:hypothetical protein